MTRLSRLLLLCLASTACTAIEDASLGQDLQQLEDASLRDATHTTDATTSNDGAPSQLDSAVNSAVDATLATELDAKSMTAADARLPEDAAVDANPWCHEFLLDSSILVAPLCCAEPSRCPIVLPHPSLPGNGP